MSTTTRPDSEVVWHQDDVTISDVMGALGGIREKFAREEAGDDEHAHPRNFIMTLIAVAASETDERIAESVCRTIGASHPAQSIVIREEAPVRGRHLDAWIKTDVQRPAMSCATQCEIITLHVHGKAADHLDALVDPLLVSGVPNYLWWMGTPPFGRRELLDTLRICDGLVVDSAHFGEPYNTFRGMSRLVKVAHHRLGLADLQWARLRPWRETIAQFFTPQDRREFLDGIAEVGIDYAGEARGNRIGASLVAGWMAAALGWKLRHAAAGAGGMVVAQYEAGPKSVEVQFRSVKREHLADGELSAVRLAGAAQGITFRISVQHDPQRSRPAVNLSYRVMHPTGGEDDAGLELAARRAEWHRDVLHENLDSLHHTATGEPPGESTPKRPIVFTRERRRADSSRVLLTMIEIGEGAPLRHVQQLEADGEAALLMDLLSTGTHDEVFNRALAAGAGLTDRF